MLGRQNAISSVALLYLARHSVAQHLKWTLVQEVRCSDNVNTIQHASHLPWKEHLAMKRLC